MKLSVVGIFDKGVPNRERIQLVAHGDLSLAYYVLVLTNAVKLLGAQTEPKIRVGGLVSYWFAGKEVKAGDVIVLYTGGGKDTESKTLLTGTTHILFWGLSQTFFNTPDARVVLMEISEWATTAGDAPSQTTLFPTLGEYLSRKP